MGRDQAGREEDPASVASALAHPDRLRAVHDVAGFGTTPQDALDRVTRLARIMFDAPVVLLTLVDDRRQYFLSQQGAPDPWAAHRATPLSHSICQYVVARRRPLVIEDARETSLTASSRAVHDLGMVAYLGAPLEDPEGHVLGALCVIDRVPRHWDETSVALLHDLARIAMDEVILEMTRKRQAEAEASARDAEDRFRAMAAELSHRVNNAVAIIGSVVRHSLRTADSLPQAARALEGRLQALVRAHDLMNRDTWVQTRLRGLIKTVLLQFGRAAKAITVTGDDIVLPSRLALIFAMTVHELASNALRHGALLSPAGRVRVRWKLIAGADGSRQIVFLWVEEGGPPVARPRRLGFGTVLIRRIAQAQDVAVRMDYRAVGLRCLLRAPLAERTPSQ